MKRLVVLVALVAGPAWAEEFNESLADQYRRLLSETESDPSAIRSMSTNDYARCFAKALENVANSKISSDDCFVIKKDLNNRVKKWCDDDFISGIDRADKMEGLNKFNQGYKAGYVAGVKDLISDISNIFIEKKCR